MRFLLVLLPLWLVASGAFALWKYFENEKNEALEIGERFARAISSNLVEDDLRKIVEVIGERNASSAEASTSLSRMASMIEGQLGPSNAGYVIQKEAGPSEWPLLFATLPALKPDAPFVWIITSYDSPVGSRGGEANASGLAATLAAAQELADSRQPANLVFAFLPHINDADSPVMECANKLLQKIRSLDPVCAILYVESMGGGEDLWLSSRDSSATPLEKIENLGSVFGAEVICLGEDSDFASTLFEMGLPAVRVSTRSLVTSSQEDDETPSAITVAASAGKLAELIRRCAAAQ
jgi:hypothetical protein